MKTIKNYSLLFLVLFFSIGKAQEPPRSEDYNYNTFEAQKKWIVGTYVSDDDPKWKMQFTKDSRCINSYIGDFTEEYTYRIEYSTRKAETPFGYVDDNVYTLYLKAVPADPNEDLTYDMYVADDGLVLYPWGHGGRFTFYRVKPKESSSSKPPSKEESSAFKEKPKEEEKESELSPRWELVKSSDYDTGYLDGGLAYEQCKKEQGKESGVSDRHRIMPIEGMDRETVEYQPEFQECKKRFFYGIKRESESYRRGFEEGWRDASMPLNKEKETTKKK